MTSPHRSHGEIYPRGPPELSPHGERAIFRATSESNGQATLVTGTLDVTDVDENLATVHLRFKKPTVQGLTEHSVPLTLSDRSGGQASFAIANMPDMVGNWTLEVYVQDTSGAKSTTLTCGLAVTARPSTVPVASSVSLSPTERPRRPP